MDTKQLRQKILDLAIRGKLVPQDPNDEPASVLLERVKAEKERLIAEGKIKRSKKSAASSDKPHYPFEIPSNWEWIRLDEISEIGTGATPSTKDSSYYNNGTICWVNSSKTNCEFITEPTTYITQKALKETNCTIYPIGTIIMAMYGEGKTRGQISELKISSATNQACAAIVPLINEYKDFIKIFLKANYWKIRTLAEGGLQPNLNLKKIASYLIPMAPLAEQERIGVEVERLMSFVDEIEQSTSLMNYSLSQVKAKILEYAISGKLVAQDPSDEPAEVLLKRVNPNAVVSTDTSHYSIPNTWIWVKLSDIFEINPKNHNNDDEDDCGFVPMSYVQDGYSGEHTFEVRKWGKVKKGYSHFQNGDIGVAKISPCFENLKSTIFHSLPNNIGAGTTELVIMRGKEIFAPFFLYLFKSPWYISKGTVYFKGVVGQQRVSRDIFTSLEVPLPPLNEQKRISAKVDELFAVIDQIQQSLE